MLSFDFKLTKLLNRLRIPLNVYEGLMEESQVFSLLKDGQWVVMLYLDIIGFELTEQIYGSLNYRQVLQILSNLTRCHVPGCLKPYHFLEHRRWGDDLVIYFYAPNQALPSAMEVSELANSVRDNLCVRLNKSCSHLIPTPLDFHVGYALLNPQLVPLPSLRHTTTIFRSGRLSPGLASTSPGSFHFLILPM